MPISMEKLEQAAPSLVKVARKVQFKKSQLGLEDQVAKVCLVMDRSISYEGFYAGRPSRAQQLLETILAVASQFDDDGEMEVFGFHTEGWYAGDVSIGDFDGAVERLFKGSRFGGTHYAPVIEQVTNHYFTKRKGLFRKAPTDDVPVFAVFLTDGAPQDPDRAVKAGVESSQHPVFFQSIAEGPRPDEFDFLAGKGRYAGRGANLNDHGGKVDNFGFWTSTDIVGTPAGELLSGLLNEFPQALVKMRTAGVLA